MSTIFLHEAEVTLFHRVRGELVDQPLTRDTL